LPDGREFKSSISGDRELLPELVDLKQPVPTEVEYLATSPTTSRIKGSGSQSLAEWLLHKVWLGGLLLALFLLPGVKVIRAGTIELRAAGLVAASPANCPKRFFVFSGQKAGVRPHQSLGNRTLAECKQQIRIICGIPRQLVGSPRR
jgi:hypothetical protein